MAETTAPSPAAPAPQPAPVKATPPKAAAPPPPAAPKTVTRREFLYYIWGASMALFLVETAGISVLFALPRFREGEFGGVIKVSATDFPKVGDAPAANNDGKFWMVTTDQGIVAHYKVCTHLGCIYKWDDLGKRFACPCHGSQFQENGDWIAGPAPRGLDRFALQVFDKSGKLLADSADGNPVQLSPDAVLVGVNTGKKITGKSHF
ncbi:MAG TPA: Rieske 2Fe-2S domain-containing protein [Anaerolineae bacterium]